MDHRTIYPTTVIILLVALRLTIGWYFFESGRSKNLDRNFSSAGFLSQAKGPLAPLYQSGLPDSHDFSNHIGQPRVDSTNPHEAGTEAWVQFQREPFAAWQEQIVFDFGRVRQSAEDHYQYDTEQAGRADQVFAFYESRLDDYFAGNRDEIAAYRHELARLNDWKNNISAEDIPYQQDRIAAKQRELKSTAASITSAVDAIEENFRDELTRDADPNSAGRPMPKPSDTLASFERFLMVTHFLIGGCLGVGFLSRFAAASAGLFLLTVIVSQPPWIVGYSTIGYQLVMLIGCLLLVATPSGRWCGVDHFMPTISLGGCCKPSGTEPRIES